MSEDTPRETRFEPYLVRLWGGEEVVIRLVKGGSACPVCGYVMQGEPPYSYGEYDESGSIDLSRQKEEWATGSMNICPCCSTQFGLSDFVPYHPGLTQIQVWAKLRALWLDRLGWSREALSQLSANLGISESQARSEAEALHQRGDSADDSKDGV